MIVRDEGATLLLITQPDHAQLAADLVGSIRTEPALAGAARNIILLATREHDNGWAEVDARPTLDPASRWPRDFMTGPADVKHELWVRGITRVAKMEPLAGALVAEHAVTVYGYRRNDAAWQPFFKSITTIRDALLRQIGMESGEARRIFHTEYRCVQLGDAFSLQFCNGWKEPQVTLGYQTTLSGATLLISPNPFEGGVVSLRVFGRRIPARRYRDERDLRKELAAAAPEVVAGDAKGV